MFTGSRLFSALLAVCAGFLASCGEFDEPQPLNPQRFFGCYAQDEFRVTIAESGVLIDGKIYPFEIHEEKVGLVIVLPLVFVNTVDGIVPRAADEHFYRIIDEDQGRYIVIADQDAVVHKLEFGTCT